MYVWLSTFHYGRRGKRPQEELKGPPSPPQELEAGGKAPQTLSTRLLFEIVRSRSSGEYELHKPEAFTGEKLHQKEVLVCIFLQPIWDTDCQLWNHINGQK